jgi:hypothetical protein
VNTSVAVQPDGTHPPTTGTHNHHHAAYGSQGGDAFHSHNHEHGTNGTPDASHGHHRNAEADDLTDLMVRSIGAVFADQETGQRPRGQRLDATLTQWAAHRARTEARYGDRDLMRERLLAEPRMSTRILARASFSVWPEQ